MSCTSPRTVPSTIVPLPAASDFSMCGSSRATAVFMTSADCSTKGSCISPLPKRSPTTCMPASRCTLTMSSALMPSARARSRSASRPLRLAVDDAPLEPLAHRQGGELGGARVLEGGGVDAREQVEHRRERVVGQVAVGVVLAAVPHEVECDLAAIIRHRRERHDLGGVDDRRVQPGLDRLVQEHRVEHRTRGGVEPERDVRDAERGVDAGVFRRDLPDRLDGLDRVAAGLLLAGRDREGERVDDDVLDAHPPLVHQGLDEARRDAHLVLGGARLALLVDRERDDRGAVLLDQRHDAPEARGGAVAVLEVHGVDDGAAADELHAGAAAPPVRSSPRPAGGWMRSPAARRPRACRRRRPGPRSRCTRRAGARPRGSGCARCRRSRPSAPRASPRGRPASRSRWCARRSPGTRHPGRSPRAGRGSRPPGPPRSCGGSRGAPPSRSDDRLAGARGSCRSSRRRARGRTP